MSDSVRPPLSKSNVTPSLFGPEPEPWEEADQGDIQCAQIVFDLPIDAVFDYVVPDDLRGQLQAGQRVRAPFGRGDRLVVGYCVGIGPPQRWDRLKRLERIVDREPLLSPRMLELTRWIADRYLCGWGQVLESVVPAGVKKQAGTREVLLVRLNPEATAEMTAKLSKKQAAIVEALRTAGTPMTTAAIRELAQCGDGPIQLLRQKGILQAATERSQVGAAHEATSLETPKPIHLNGDQQGVLDRVLKALREREHKTFLLAGVTGSGKTEVYIRAIEEVVSYGRQAIVLVPEISLTPQTIRRFKSRFPSIAVLHSHQSDVERHAHWQQIARGQVQVVVGARSAVFAPTPHLGLIVIDEEHETSFKQDITPRYHAREVARKRSELEGVPLILGSATPTLESWLRAKTGVDELLRMPRRVEGLPMPPVTIVDIREDAMCLGGASIGRALSHAMQHALEKGGQIILFLNLRGYSTVVWCKACGASMKCPHCDVSLTWHKEAQTLLCHSCDYRTPPPVMCPSCERPGLRYLGTGTQRLEQEVRTRFPGVACTRMDSDSMKRPGSHDKALEAFRHGDTKILLGTQMISKGLDFPNVTLVGVIDADTILHQPDFRSSERTFQLIAQVAGRTGRSKRGGRVLVQTSAPQEPAIVRASRHDYVGFAGTEMEHRRQMHYPPFSHIARVILRGPVEKDVHDESARLATVCEAEALRLGLQIGLLGPAPAPVARLKSNFRYHLQLSADELLPLQTLWRSVGPNFKPVREVELSVDVDPLNLR